MRNPTESTEKSRSHSPTFGEQLRRVRMSRGLRQRDLAGDGISASYISFLEADRRVPSERVLQLLCDRLNCRVEDLLPPEVYADFDARDVATPALYLKMARAALTAGKPYEAQVWYERVRSEYQGALPAGQEAAYGLARAAEAAGQWEQAAERYAQCMLLAEQPSYPHLLGVLLGMARCLARAGDAERALTVATRARQEISRLRLDTTEIAVEIRAILATLLCEQGSYADANQSISEALEIIPAISDHHQLIETYWRASVDAFKEARPGAAQELAERITDVNAYDYGHTRGMLRAVHGSLLLRQEKSAPDAARETLQLAIEDLDASGATTDAARCRNELASAFLALGRPRDAEQATAEVLSQPGVPAVEQVRARILSIAILALLGEADRARAAGEQAIADLNELPPSWQVAGLWSHLGEGLTRVGDTEGAIVAYRRAISGLGIDLPPTLARSAVHPSAASRPAPGGGKPAAS